MFLNIIYSVCSTYISLQYTYLYLSRQVHVYIILGLTRTLTPSQTRVQVSPVLALQVRTVSKEQDGRQVSVFKAFVGWPPPVRKPSCSRRVYLRQVRHTSVSACQEQGHVWRRADEAIVASVRGDVSDRG